MTSRRKAIRGRSDMKTRITLVAAVCALAVALTASCQTVRYTKAYGKRYVYLRDVARYYGMSLVRGRSGCELRSRYSRIAFKYGKKTSTLNGVKVNLLNAPFRKGAEPMLSEHDFLLFLDPILRRNAIPKKRIRSVMLDPGHGRKDTGAIGSRFKEKDIVLQIARRLKRKLEKAGYKVVMTRNDDTFLSLKERADLCKKLKPDIFISIHCNSAKAKSARGLETYCLTPAGEASFGANKPQSAKELGNATDKANAKLAYDIQKHALRSTGATDRGVKHARFFVLKNILCPGVLIETGFISNYSEESILASSRYQEKIADGILDGVNAFKKASERR
jgi:N-acetylmuramoyl-L-alanine amidase